MADDIFARLKSDHDRHRKLFEAIKETTGASDERKALFDELKTDAMAHAAAEEGTLYAAMMEQPDVRQDAQHSVKEHADIGAMFVELTEMDMGSSGWLNRFNSLSDEYIHHIDEEEDEKFSKAREAIGEAKSEELKAAFESRKQLEIARAREGADVDEIKHAIEEEEGAK